MSLPPVHDFSDDPEGFQAHIDAEMAKPCQHCERLAPTTERPGFDLFGGNPGPTEIVCTACGGRRATFYPRSSAPREDGAS
jgi:hypothetical protein